jgi:hypothetical protein
MFVEIMSCNLAVELLQKANVVIARNIVNSSKATATAPVDSNVSCEVKLLHKKLHSCWGNEVIARGSTRYHIHNIPLKIKDIY